MKNTTTNQTARAKILQAANIVACDKQKRADQLYWLEIQEMEREEREERGKEFQKARESAELSRYAMARLAGISASTLKRFELGQNILRPRLVEKALENALENERMKKVFGVLVNQLPIVLRHLDSSRPCLH